MTVERLFCEICGHEARSSLQLHIIHKHGMNNQDYLDKYPGASLYTDAYRRRQRDSMLLRDQSYRKKLSENTRKYYRNKTWVKKHNEALRKAQRTQQARENHRIGAIRFFKNQTSEQIEVRKKISKDSWKNTITRKNRVEGLRRAHRSIEGRKNHSEAKKRHFNGLTPEQKEQARINLKNVWARPELRKKLMRLSNIGLQHAMSEEGRKNFYKANKTPELREKRRLIALKRLENQPLVSGLSKKFEQEMLKADLRPLSEQRVGKFVVDFLFPTEKIVVECDGDYWHGHPSKYKTLNKVQKRVTHKDFLEANYCKQNGYTLLRFWERDIHKNINACINKVKGALNADRS